MAQGPLVIPANEIRSEIEALITRHVGIVGSILNVQPILQMTLEHCFYGDCFATKESIVESLHEYKIPTIPAKVLVESIVLMVTRVIRGIDHDSPLNVAYDFELDDACNLYVFVHDTRPVTYTPNKEFEMPTREEILESIENGDYISERIRRMYNL